MFTLYREFCRICFIFLLILLQQKNLQILTRILILLQNVYIIILKFYTEDENEFLGEKYRTFN